MVIKEAIRQAERNKLLYGDIWHVTKLQDFEVVKQSYFDNPNPPFPRTSYYNTEDKVYNDVSCEDIMVRMKIGDLLEAKEKYIIHQCNCVSIGAGGLAYHLFNKFPFADVYSERDSGEEDEKGRTILKYKDKPGTIKISGNGNLKRFVINAFSQYYPGGQNDYHNDNEQKRLEYFKNCLEEVLKIKDLDSIAFPYEYGCGIAGGNWKVYKQMIYDFAIQTDAAVYIYKLPNL